MFFGIPGKTSHPEAPDREYLDALTLTVRAEVRTEYPTEIVSGMSWVSLHFPDAYVLALFVRRTEMDYPEVSVWTF